MPRNKGCRLKPGWRKRLADYDNLERLQPPPDGYILGVDGTLIPNELAQNQARMRMKMPIITGPYEVWRRPPSKDEEA